MISIKQGIEIIDLGEDDGTVIFDSSTGDTSVLDSVAADIFRGFERFGKTDDVVDFLAGSYNESPDVIRKDVLEFVDSLLKQGLLISEES